MTIILMAKAMIHLSMKGTVKVFALFCFEHVLQKADK